MDNSTTITSQPDSRSKLPRAFEILSQAWKIYEQQKVTFWGIMIIPSLVLFIANALVSGIAPDLMVRSFSSPDGAKTSHFNFVSLILGFIIFVIQIWSQVALIYAVKDNQEKIGTIEAYNRSINKIIPYLWINILTGIAIFIGFILFVIPGIIFGVWFSLAPFILIVEDLRGRQALSKSREYVRGYFGSVFWRFLFIFILIIICVFVVSLIFYFLKVLKTSFGNWIVIAVNNLLFLPLATAYGFLIYESLKSLKEQKSSS